MTLEQAKEELCDIDTFCKIACDNCTANDYYCPSECEMLKKARTLDFDRIIKCFANNDGDLYKVFAYIKQAKTNRKRGGY